MEPATKQERYASLSKVNKRDVYAVVIVSCNNKDAFLEELWDLNDGNKMALKNRTPHVLWLFTKFIRVDENDTHGHPIIAAIIEELWKDVKPFFVCFGFPATRLFSDTLVGESKKKDRASVARINEAVIHLPIFSKSLLCPSLTTNFIDTANNYCDAHFQARPL